MVIQIYRLKFKKWTPILDENPYASINKVNRFLNQSTNSIAENRRLNLDGSPFDFKNWTVIG